MQAFGAAERRFASTDGRGMWREVRLGFSAYFFLLSVQYLLLGDGALTFAAPLLITAMAGKLGEKLMAPLGGRGCGLPRRRCHHPSGHERSPVSRIVAAGLCTRCAGRDVATRRMTASETSLAILLTANLFQIGFGLLSLPWGG